MILRVFKRLLRSWGYGVVSARSISRLEDSVSARINFGIEVGGTFYEQPDDELDRELLESLEALKAEASG